MLVQRNGGLFQVLQLVYPGYQFNKNQFGSRGKKSSQRWLLLMISEILGDKWSRFSKKTLLTLKRYLRIICILN